MTEAVEVPKDRLYQTNSKKQQNKRPPRISRNEEDALKNTNQNPATESKEGAVKAVEAEEGAEEDEDWDE